MSLYGLLFFWGLPSQASQPMGLYEAEVEVADQGRQARADAMTEAMAAVLIKVNGSSTIVQEDVIDSAMKQASRYVRQYRYRSESDKSGKQNRLLLWVAFDNSSIDKLLARYGFTAWGAVRPATLVWLGVQQGKRRVLVGANDHGLVREVLDDAAQRRAIPVRLPLLDLTDQSQMSAADIWGGFFENIVEASRRYETQAVLIGKLYPLGREWEARWTLKYKGESYEWRHRAADVSAVVASGVEGTGERLSRQLLKIGSGDGESGPFLLRVEGLDGLNDFRRVSDYLVSLRGVRSVSLHSTKATSSRFLVEVEGRRAALLQSIELGDVLVKVNMPVIEPLTPPAPQGAVSSSAPRQAPSTMPPGAAVQPEDNHAETGQGAEAAQEAGAEGQSSGEGVQGQEAETQPKEPPLEELVYRLLS